MVFVHHFFASARQHKKKIKPEITASILLPNEAKEWSRVVFKLFTLTNLFESIYLLKLSSHCFVLNYSAEFFHFNNATEQNKKLKRLKIFSFLFCVNWSLQME